MSIETNLEGSWILCQFVRIKLLGLGLPPELPSQGDFVRFTVQDKCFLLRSRP